MSLRSEAVPALSTLTGAIGSTVHCVHAVGGGDHRAAYRLDTADGPMFFKCARAEGEQMFAAEAAGLEALAAAAALRIPGVRACGTVDGLAFLALEWVDFTAASPECEQRLGRQLAKLHQVLGEAFGWDRDNTIGATRQVNTWQREWARFFADQRLGVQLALARSNGATARLLDRGERLRERSGELFAGHRPQPSLLHGDLWGGNWAADDRGQPVLFDPAVYFGDREVDVAMTRLFGGFGPAFYSAYDAEWPLVAGAGSRVALYNLYHVLNHFNLFGGAYHAQAQRMVDALLAELG